MVEVIGGASGASGGATYVRENDLGSDCTGNNLESNRVLTLSNAATSSNERVYLDGVLLTPTTEYTPSHKAAASTITFGVPVADTHKISTLYEL